MFKYLLILFLVISISPTYAQGDNPNITFAKDTFARIQTQDIAGLRKVVEPELLSQVKTLHNLLPQGSATEAQTYIDNPQWKLVSLQYRFDDKFYLFTIKMDKGQVVNWEILHLNGSLQQQGLRTLLNSIIFLSVFILVVKTVYRCIGMKATGLIKLGWLLIIIPGLGSLNFNYLSEEFSFTLWSWVLLGVDITQEGLLNEWVFHTGFPLGALLFWLYLKFSKQLP